jgi:magnesium chelatase subunit H
MLGVLEQLPILAYSSLYITFRAYATRRVIRLKYPRIQMLLRISILEGNASQYGTSANVHFRIPVADYIRREPWLKEIEKAWGMRLENNYRMAQAYSC